MTNDGDMTYKLTHPKHNVDKTYIATVENILNPNTIAKKAQKNKAIPLKNFIISPLCNMFSKKAIINT